MDHLIEERLIFLLFSLCYIIPKKVLLLLFGGVSLSQSIEILEEQIYNQNTKEYFNEVYRSFVNGNNRSAVVFLYSVVLYDLYAKLEELSSTHNDQTATTTLREISDLQTKNPTSSEWENLLIDRIDKQTNLFEKGEIIDFNSLKQKRNLSAHPTILSLELYNPDSYTVQSLMFNMLRSVLIKPPYFTNDIVTTLVKDLEAREDSGVPISDQELESLIKNRYLRHLSNKKQEGIFKTLWKFIFNLTNEDTNKNRTINLRALNVFYKNCSIDIPNIIRNSQSQFGVKKGLISILIKFIAQNAELFKVLDDTTQAEIHTHVNSDNRSRLFAVFLHDSFEDHLEDLRCHFKNNLVKINSMIEDIKFLKNLAKKFNALHNYFEFIIDLYTDSFSFNEADIRFDLLIDFLDEFNEQQLKDLLEKASNNSQCYVRIRGSKDHKQIEEKIRTFDKSYERPSKLE